MWKRQVQKLRAPIDEHMAHSDRLLAPIRRMPSHRVVGDFYYTAWADSRLVTCPTSSSTARMRNATLVVVVKKIGGLSNSGYTIRDHA
jgi:hypothetical protein